MAVEQRWAYDPLPTTPDTPEGFVLALETASGRGRTSLLKAGRERFRGQLFNALLDRSRAHLGGGEVEGPRDLLQMAAQIARSAVDTYAQGKCFFAIGDIWHDFGQFKPAITAYRRAAHLFRQVGVTDGEARVLARCGQVLTRMVENLRCLYLIEVARVGCILDRTVSSCLQPEERL